jgi:prephenate dehydratase
MATPASLTPEEEKKLLAAFRALEELSEHELPVVKFNCRKAKNEIWQALFELDLLPATEGKHSRP